MTTQTEPLVTIENRKRRMKVFNLAGEHMRAREDFGYQRVARTETIHNPRNGAVMTKAGRASVPSSITFLAKEKRENLPVALLRCPEIKSAWDRGDLKVTFQDGPLEVPARTVVKKTHLQLQREREEAIAQAEARAAGQVEPMEVEAEAEAEGRIESEVPSGPPPSPE